MSNAQACPLVSVVMATYNRVEYLQEAIDSIICQDYPNIEIIVSDNHSTDGTPAIMQRYCEKHRHIRYFRNATNIGMSANGEKIWFEYPKGQYIVGLPDDDYFIDKQFISRSVEFLENNEQCSYVVGNYVIKNETANQYEKKALSLSHITDGKQYFINYLKVPYVHIIGTQTAMVRARYVPKFRELYANSGSAMDMMLWLYLQLQGNVGHFDEYVVTYRVHGDNASIDTFEGYSYFQYVMGIESLYKIAAVRGIFTEQELSGWKSRMIAHGILMFIKVHGNEILNEVKNDYPEAYWDSIEQNYFNMTFRQVIYEYNSNDAIKVKNVLKKKMGVRYWYFWGKELAYSLKNKIHYNNC